MAKALGRTASGQAIRRVAVLTAFALLSCAAPAAAADLVVGSYGADRTDNDWGLTESYLTTARGYLEDPASFGPSGTVPTSFTVAPGIDVASADTLAGTDVFFTGWVLTGTYTDEEKAALRAFVLGGGALIATTDDAGHTMVDAFGLTQGDGTGTPTENVITDPAHPIADGPFGTVTSYRQYAATGNYPTLGPDAHEIGRYAAGPGTTIAVIERGALGPGSGPVVFVADVDVFSNADDGAEYNATLIKNIFAFVAGQPAVPALRVADATGDEGNAGTTDLKFDLTLSAAADTPVDVHFTTVDDTATSPSDFEAASGDVRFEPGETAKPITVHVAGDTTVEPDETFRLELTSAGGARLVDPRATGTIRNDDVATPPPGTLLPYGSSGYRYLQLGDPTATVPGFEAEDFDDSTWSLGQAPFGQPIVCPRLAVTPWTGDTALLVRRQFTVPPGARNVTVHAALDNDITVYVNGHNVTGAFDPAMSEGCAAPDNVGPFPVSAAFLHEGVNTLAARAVDRGSESYLDLEITADFTDTATLHVVKQVANDDGGSKLAGDFDVHVKSGGADVPGSPHPGDAGGTTYTLEPGTYGVSEDASAGYAGSFSAECAGGTITLAAGDDKTCTITNDDVAPKLTVIKDVVNNDGGSATAGDFTMHIGDAATFPGDSGGTTRTLSAGTYEVTETGGPGGYTATYSDACAADGTVTLAPGDEKTCTVTNDDGAAAPASLTVVKQVVTDDGGTATAGEFTMHIRSGASDVDTFPGDTGGTTRTLVPGTYRVTESGGPDGYTGVISGACAADGTVTLAAGEARTCTVVNDDPKPGTATRLLSYGSSGYRYRQLADSTSTIPGFEAEDFDDSTWSLGQAPFGQVPPGFCPRLAVTPWTGDTALLVRRHFTVPAGARNVTVHAALDNDITVYVNGHNVTGPFDPAMSEFCAAPDNVGPFPVSAAFLHEGDNLVAARAVDRGNESHLDLEITADFGGAPDTATLHVVKQVVNDDGGSASAGDFTMHIGDAATFPGDSGGTTRTVDAGTYSVSESGGPAGYTGTISGDCAADGTITLAGGDDKTCIVTNDDVAAKLTVVKQVVNDNGGTATAADFTMHIGDVATFPGDSAGTMRTLTAGSYAVTESDGPGGYAATFSGACAADGTVTLAPGADKTCTVINDDVAPKLTVVKQVVNDDGGAAKAADFTMHIGDAASFPGDSAGTTRSLNAGSYSVTESGGPARYDASFSGACGPSGAVTLALGDEKTCTVTNNDPLPPSPGCVTYPNFASTVGLNLLNSAAVAGTVLRLTPSEGNTIGQAWYGQRVPVAGGFTTQFDFQFTDLAGLGDEDGPGADGITFAIQNQGADAAGNPGGALGYQGLSNSLVVEFDTFNNGFFSGDSDGNHVAVHSRGQDPNGPGPEGDSLLAASEAPVRMQDGQRHRAAISYSGGTLSVRLDGTPVLSVDVDLATLLALDQGRAFVGFTAATGAGAENHDILNWNFCPADQPPSPSLTVVKKVINDDGGTATAADFTMHIGDAATFPGDSSGTTRTLAAGTYSVTETGGPAGYTATFTGACAADGTITLAAGDDKTCTVTNDDIAPKLTVVKQVVNNDGGTAKAADFTMHIGDAATFPGDSAGTTRTLSAGAYTVTETGGPAGYAGTFSGACAADGTVTLAPGDDKTCTVTNDDVAPTLTVIKQVVNDDGGTATAGDFTMHIGNAATFPGDSAGTTRTVDTGTYTVSETGGPAGYTGKLSGDCAGDGTVTLAAGDAKTCTITNDDVAPKLTVVKRVVNDDGGTGGAAAFTMHVRTGGTDVTSFPGDAGGTTRTLRAGGYTVAETGGPSGYAATLSGDCGADGTVSLAPGETKTCTITNNDVAPTLTVIKRVVNDDGGTAAAASFTMHIRSGGTDVAGKSPFAGSAAGTTRTLTAGAYTVGETGGPAGYAASISGACTTTGAVTLAVGDTKTCTITNDDVAPTLTVIKHVINDNGGTAAASNFTMHIRSGSVDVAGKSPFAGAESPGTTRSLAAGTYSVSETGGPANYTSTIGGDCSSTGAVTLSPGQSKTCTIANDDVALPADVALDAAVSTASPALGNNFTYTLTATNLGPATARSVIVTDDIAAGVAVVTVPAGCTQAAISGGRTRVTCAIGDLPARPAPGSARTLAIAVEARLACTFVGTSGNDADSAVGATAGADVICGGGGGDTLSGGGGDDQIYGLAPPGMLPATVTASASASSTTPDPSLANNTRSTSVTVVAGDDGADTLSGNDGSDQLFGNDGDDTLSGNAGADSEFGEAGADTVEGGAGGDSLNGGNGGDTLLGNDGSDTLHGNAGDDTLSGGADGDIVFGDADADLVEGGTGTDVLHGGDGNDQVHGGPLPGPANQLFGDGGSKDLCSFGPGKAPGSDLRHVSCELPQKGTWPGP